VRRIKVDKKRIIKKLIPFIIAIEIILFSDTLQSFGIGIIAGALLVEILNLKLSDFYSKNEKGFKTEAGYIAREFHDIKQLKTQLKDSSYNSQIIAFIEELKLQFTTSIFYKETARLALNQLVRVVDKFEKFKNILDIKLEQKEITYERFMSVTEEVYYNILDNLEKVKNIYQSIEDIDVNYIESRINTLEEKDDLSREMKEELISLKNRKSMLLNELESVDKYISINEKAITDIDNMKIKLGKLLTSSKQANREFDLNIAELRKMAKRINEYSAE